VVISEGLHRLEALTRDRKRDEHRPRIQGEHPARIERATDNAHDILLVFVSMSVCDIIVELTVLKKGWTTDRS
jgi:hypothetical protein